MTQQTETAGTETLGNVKLSTGEWTNELWSISAMQNVSAIKRMN